MKNKNNKGFTLLELLAVFGVLGLLVIIALPVYNRIRLNTLENQYHNLVNYIEVEAEKYARDTGHIMTNVDTLVKAGYLEPDDELENVYDPRNNNVLNCYVIEIDITDNEYTATMIEEEPKVHDDGTCDDTFIIDGVQVYCNGEECTDEWYGADLIGVNESGNLELSVNFADVNIDKYNKVQYKWTNLYGYNSLDERIVIEIKKGSVLNTTYTVLVKADNDTYRASQAIKIDTEKPTILSDTYLNNENRWAASKKLTIKATDMTGSGIAGYAYIGANDNCKDAKYVNESTHVYDSEGNYKYCVKDKAGNISEGTVVVTNIDKSTPEKPTITASDGKDQSKWHTSNFNLSFTISEVSPSGITYFYGFAENTMTSVGTSVPINSSNNGQTLYVKACNGAGTCGPVASYKIKYDNTAPSYESGGSLGQGTISKPTYKDNNGGSGGVTVKVCVTTSSSAPSINDSCFGELNTTYSYKCGNTYTLYSFASDAAGNTSAVMKHTNYYKKCSTSSGSSSSNKGSSSSNTGSSSSSGKTSSSGCDTTCQMKKNSAEWARLENSNDPDKESKQNALHEANVGLAENNSDCGGGCSYNENGTWHKSDGSKLYGDSTSKTSSSSSSSSTSSKGSSGNTVGSAASKIFGSSSSSSSKSSSSSSSSKSSGSSCLVEGTQITLADGTKKAIDDITYDDLLLVWSYDKGRLVYEYPLWLEQEGISDNYLLTTFSDGTELKTVMEHAIFSVDHNEFVSVTDTERFKVGTKVLKLNEENQYEIVEVTSIKTIYEKAKFYFVASTRYYNVFANDLLTTEGFGIFTNNYGFDKNVTWPKDRLDYISNSDNLYKYSEFTETPYYIFKGFRIEELKNLKDIYDYDINDIKGFINRVLLGSEMYTEPDLSVNGKRLWKVTADNGYIKDIISNNYYEEGSYYKLPNVMKNSNKEFIGWYNMADGKMYQANDYVRVWHGMHFEAIWK